jgi:CelD/BcsL family acetyltransferase involved in cellulose biosynthesis
VSGKSATADVIFEQTTSLEAVRDDWTRLSEQSTNVFATWEWATAWWRHFGRGRRPLVTSCGRRGGETFALLPIYVWKKAGVRVLRLIGHGPADELGPLCAPQHRASVAAALRGVLEGTHSDIFLGEQLRRDEAWAQHLGATVRGTGSSPVLQLSRRSWDDFLAARSANFRQQVRRRERALGKLGLRFRLCDNRDRVARDLDILFALHRRRWGGHESEFSRRTAFHRDFATRAFERGWLRLWFLELNDTQVAAWYGLRFRGVDSYYQAGRDPAWDRFAVGFVLLAHSVREAMSDGMQEYRFGRGAEEYKSRFADDDAEVQTLVLGRGLKGRFAILAAEAALRGSSARRLVGSSLRT